MAQRNESRTTLLVGSGLAALIAGLWVGLTALTGDTYHLAPVIVAFTPALAARIDERAIPIPVLLAIGLALTAAAWGAIVALGIEPTATLLRDQPGGVPGEVLGAAVVGAVVAAWMARTAADRGDG